MNKCNTPTKYEMAAQFRQLAGLLESDEPIAMDWTGISILISTILTCLDIRVTDEVYDKLFGLNWSKLRYYLTKNRIKKKQGSTTSFNEVVSIIPPKYKHNVI